MTLPLARDSLTIFVDGEEVPGLIVYGVRAPDAQRAVSFPSDAWVAAPHVAQQFVFEGEAWRVTTWEVPIVLWPTAEEFVVAVRRTLRAMIEGDCRVAWIAAEGFPFCDPPQLFDPACMSGGVLAWMTDRGDFECPLDPERPLSPVTDDRLRYLRNHTSGLADVL